MPYVNIKITREGATKEQKAALIKGVTDLLVDVLDKNPATTVVVIDESRWSTGALAGFRSSSTDRRLQAIRQKAETAWRLR